ncbi:MAG: TRAP transporter small permease [Sphaerochaeta sp.]|nr:TRAP transporter small permease [Sphaerochaeta sp.]
MSKKLASAIHIMETAIGIYVPVTAFLFMFIAFCLQIFSRYFLNHQFEWTYEYTVIGFIWTVAFGACAASKRREHVSFSLIYDRFGQRGQAIMKLVGNTIILIAFCIMIYPAFDFIRFMGIKTTPVLKIPISYVYAPFLAFLTFSILYLIKDCLIAIQTLLSLKQHKPGGLQ